MIDTEYLAAVERGDMDTARRLMVEFAVSKGYVPVEVYHGTLRKFFVFDATRGKKDQPGNEIRDAVRTPQFFSFNEEFAKDYATFNMHWRDVKKVRLIKAFLRFDKLWDYRKPEDVDAAVAAGFPRKEIERGDWRDIESRPFQRWLLEQGYDAFTNFERFAVNIAVFKPSQIKSAETVSMKGSKIVPLSKRFDVTKDDIRNPRMPDSDSEYLAAVERGDMKTAQRMVKEAAKEAGYTVGPVYHGTDTGTWTTFDKNRKTGNSPTGVRGFFFSPDKSVAEEYARWKTGGRDPGRIIQAYLKKPKRVVGKTTLDTDQYVATNPSQIKSADPVTYDDAGNVIPLSKRFDVTKDDIRNPRTPDSIEVIEDRPVEPDDLPMSAGFGVRRGNRKVICNVWGNLVGYEGSKRVETFADNYDAADWLNGQKREPQKGPIRLNPSSTPPQFPYDYAAYLKKNFPSIWAKGGNIRGNDTFRWWTAYRSGDRSPTVMHWWQVTRPAWIARHFRDHRLPGVIAQIKWGTVGTLGVAGMKRVVEDAIRHEIR